MLAACACCGDDAQHTAQENTPAPANSAVPRPAPATPNRLATEIRPLPDLAQEIARLVPAPGEDRFLAIPWRTDLLEARDEAERTGKPLFMWVMDGHPLGLV